MDRFTFAQCIKSEQNEDTVKLIGEIDTEMLNRRDLIERLYYALPLVERMILEIFKLVPESDIEYYQQGIMRTPIEIIENNNVIFEIKTFAGSREQAKMIVDNWENNAETLYPKLLELLIK